MLDVFSPILCCHFFLAWHPLTCTTLVNRDKRPDDQYRAHLGLNTFSRIPCAKNSNIRLNNFRRLGMSYFRVNLGHCNEMCVDQRRPVSPPPFFIIPHHPASSSPPPLYAPTFQITIQDTSVFIGCTITAPESHFLRLSQASRWSSITPLKMPNIIPSGPARQGQEKPASPPAW